MYLFLSCNKVLYKNEKLQQLMRVRFVKGPEELLNKFSELKVRAAVVEGGEDLY